MKGMKMSEQRRYYVDKEVLKERFNELVDFTYTQEPTMFELTLNASVDAIATYQLKIDGYITRKGNLNE